MLRRRTPRSLRERMNESRFDNYRNRRRIYESSEVDDFIEDIERTYKKYFPKSLIKIRKSDILGSKGIYAECYLAKDESEVPHRILDNDTFHIKFCIETLKNFNDLPDVMILEWYHKSIKLNPSDDFYYCDFKQLPFRKTKGDAVKILKTLDRYFKLLKDTLIEELENDNIHYDNIDVAKSKI